MAKKYKKQNNLEAFMTFILLISEIILKIVMRMSVFIYDGITFYTSSYKSKSNIGLIKTMLDKGVYGEFTFYRKLIKVFGKPNVLANLYLDHTNTMFTEVDLVAVSNKGIYVFEVKNYAGYIYGSEKDTYWTQVLNKWVKNKFYNPLKQNYAHIKALENYLTVEKSSMIPMIVFSNRSKLSKINISNTNYVNQFKDTLKRIKHIERTSLDNLSQEVIEDILIKLLSKSHADEETKLKHIEAIKSHIKST